MKWGWSRAQPSPARASVERKCERRPSPPAPSCKKSGLGRQKKLEARCTRPYMGLTQFARACGRVLVGGHPDKRPDSRQGWETDGGGWISPQITLPAFARRPLPNSDQQPEAKPANPESPRGTQLKATTERAFFGLAGPPKTSTEEACPSLPGVRGLPKRRLPGSGRFVR